MPAAGAMLSENASIAGAPAPELQSLEPYTMHQMGTGQPESAFVSPEGYQRSLELLRACVTEHGFVATPTTRDNYRRLWARDSSIIGLAALLTGDEELISVCRRTLQTFADCQGPHGEIPSNIDPNTRRVSFGGTAGRVDSDLWFVICCGAYWRTTGDNAFLERMLKPLERVRFLLGAWEFNNRGLLFVPPTGDWADEYVQSGYVLYDQLLYLQAQREFCNFHRFRHASGDHDLHERVSRLYHLIHANYWFGPDGVEPEPRRDAYHEVLYKHARRAAPRRGGCYWMPFFSPLGYGYRFDALANALVGLLGVATEEQSATVQAYLQDEVLDSEFNLLPAFWPVITPKDEEWDELQMTCSYAFKNEPYEYQNGGLWPMVNGFYAASLAQRGEAAAARDCIQGLHAANRLKRDGQAWGFSEYLDGRTRKPGGTGQMGWSAAGAIIAEQYLRGQRIFEIS